MMTNLILAAADAQVAQSTLEKFGLGDFGIEGRYILFQLVGFLIFFAVVYFKLIKPVTGAMEERQAKIDAGIKHAEEMKLKLDAAAVESAAIIKVAQGDATKLIDEARISAKAFLEKQTQEATVKAQDLITKAQHSTELEHRKMIAEARGEIARLVVDTTRQVLANELTDEERARYNDAAAKQLTVA
ncbi:MAG: ATP synthase F0 subunit B [Verrucomicrobiia bacterium]|tara:strand:- start:4486 stop:5046 length:561 start_codon:yes stop_codon:yes gene_type:complete